jgi:hypothetical protein
LELLGDRLRDELRVEPGRLISLMLDVLLRQRMQVAPQRVDLDTDLPITIPPP